MTIRNVNEDSRSVKWRASEVINLSSMSAWALIFFSPNVPWHFGRELQREWSNTIMKCDLDSTRCKFNLRCIEVKITEAAKRSKNSSMNLNIFPMFYMVTSSSFSAQLPEEFNLRNWEKLSWKRIFCGTEMLLTRKHSFVLSWSQADCYCRRSKKLSPSREMLISFNWHCLLKISCKVSLKKKSFSQ